MSAEAKVVFGDILEVALPLSVLLDFVEYQEEPTGRSTISFFVEIGVFGQNPLIVEIIPVKISSLADFRQNPKPSVFGGTSSSDR